MPKRQRDGSGERFQIGEYYLDQPHPEHLGFWYACRYDSRTGQVSRRSLRERDFEQAKIKLAQLVAAAPKTKDAAPSPDQVLTLAILKAYMDGHGATIASQEAAERAIRLFTLYLTNIKRIDATVAFWTPAQQLECARWLHSEYDHAASYITRCFNVMRSAFIDATKLKIRIDAVGSQVEAALMSRAPEIVMREHKIAVELKMPKRARRRAPLWLDDMARVLDRCTMPHLFRFAILSLTTWARPQAVIDFDPQTQVNWREPAIDLAPPGWVPTKKHRPQLPMTACLAGWLDAWTKEDAERDAADLESGQASRERGLLVYKHKRVVTVKRAMRRIGTELGLEGFSQKRFRSFMADQTRTLFRMVSREQRSLMLGHAVKEGSETTDYYESGDPWALADVALATDCIMTLLAERTERPLFAVDALLTRDQLEAIGARVMPKVLEKSGKDGGRDRDRTCDPYHVKVVLFR